LIGATNPNVDIELLSPQNHLPGGCRATRSGERGLRQAVERKLREKPPQPRFLFNLLRRLK
jgi:Fe-S cluster biogenesis protein NfuA